MLPDREAEDEVTAFDRETEFEADAWSANELYETSTGLMDRAQACRGYAKETMQRALAATRKRHAHLLAQKQLEEQSSTEFPNGGGKSIFKCVKSPRENKTVSVKNSAI